MPENVPVLAHVRMLMRVLAPVLVLALSLVPSSARADDDTSTLFAHAAAALQQGRSGDAIADLEALADRGVVDPVASYDRGLAYAMRVRSGSELPGDLGRAAQGFEEARELSKDPALSDDATRALMTIRAEVARRRVRAGESVALDQGPPVARVLSHLLTEDAWAWLAVTTSIALGLGLFARWLASQRRARIAAGVAIGIATPALAVCIAMTLAARHDRISLGEGVIVVPAALPSDERGIARQGAAALPEAARVELTEARPGWTRIRWGAVDAWIASTSVRPLERAD
jgi:hypothetical protein